MHKLDINQVYNGDSNLMIKSIESESVDLVIIDPPYKIRKKTDEINSLAKAVKKYNEELQRDNLINEYDKSILEELVRVMKRINIYIWCNGEQIPSYIDFFVKGTKVFIKGYLNSYITNNKIQSFVTVTDIANNQDEIMTGRKGPHIRLDPDGVEVWDGKRCEAIPPTEEELKEMEELLKEYQ